jgi:arsenate reductase-like glutaredoxin family protein
MRPLAKVARAREMIEDFSYDPKEWDYYNTTSMISNLRDMIASCEIAIRQLAEIEKEFVNGERK